MKMPKNIKLPIKRRSQEVVKKNRMLILHKRQITVVALLILIGAAGYLNWSFQQEAVDPEVAAVYGEVSKKLGEAQMVSTELSDEQTTAPTASPQSVTDDYFAQAVGWARENGITSGTSDTTFSPDMTCTRSQVVTFLWRAAGCPEPEKSSHSFTDLKTAEYYYDAVLWAVEQEITNGMTPTTFQPNGFCTRGQVVTFLWRYLV